MCLDPFLVAIHINGKERIDSMNENDTFEIMSMEMDSKSNDNW
jgi:hypothetical protein